MEKIEIEKIEMEIEKYKKIKHKQLFYLALIHSFSFS
jgi:hypothetical protein